jgi:uncharacterized membrane protein
MNLDRSIIRIHIILLLIVFVIGVLTALPFFGAFCLLAAVIDVIAGFTHLILENRSKAATLLLCGGLLLLIGFSICSLFPLNFH